MILILHLPAGRQVQNSELVIGIWIWNWNWNWIREFNKGLYTIDRISKGTIAKTGKLVISKR